MGMEEARLLALLDSTSKAFDNLEMQLLQHKYYLVDAALDAIRVVAPFFQRRKEEPGNAVAQAQQVVHLQEDVPQREVAQDNGILEVENCMAESAGVQVGHVEIGTIVEERQDDPVEEQEQEKCGEAGAWPGELRGEEDCSCRPVLRRKSMWHIEEDDAEVVRSRCSLHPEEAANMEVDLDGSAGQMVGTATTINCLTGGSSEAKYAMRDPGLDVGISLDLDAINLAGSGLGYGSALPLAQFSGALREAQSCEVGLVVKAPTCMYMVEGRMSRMASRESGGMVKFEVDRFSKQAYLTDDAVPTGAAWHEMADRTDSGSMAVELGRLEVVQDFQRLGAVEEPSDDMADRTDSGSMAVELGGLEVVQDFQRLGAIEEPSDDMADRTDSGSMPVELGGLEVVQDFQRLGAIEEPSDDMADRTYSGSMPVELGGLEVVQDFQRLGAIEEPSDDMADRTDSGSMSVELGGLEVVQDFQRLGAIEELSDAVAAGGETEPLEDTNNEVGEEVTSQSPRGAINTRESGRFTTSLDWQEPEAEERIPTNPRESRGSMDWQEDPEGRDGLQDDVEMEMLPKEVIVPAHPQPSLLTRSPSADGEKMSCFGSSGPIDMGTIMNGYRLASLLEPALENTSTEEGEADVPKPRRPNVVERGNIRSFLPLLKQQPAPPPARPVKVRALEAAHVARRQEEQKALERKMRKEHQKLLKDQQKEDKAKQLREEERQMKDRKREQRLDQERLPEQSRSLQDSDVGSKSIAKLSVTSSRTVADCTLKKKQFTSTGSTKLVLADCSNTCSNTQTKANRVLEAKQRIDIEKARKLEEDRKRKEEWRSKGSELAAKKRGRQETDRKHRHEKRKKQEETMLPYRDHAEQQVQAEVKDQAKGDEGTAEHASDSMQQHQAVLRDQEMRCTPEHLSQRVLAALDLGPQSYEISPYRGSSDEEDEDVPQKPIPLWARSENLFPQLMRQRHIDPDEIFTNAKTCSLKEVFETKGSKKKSDWGKRSFSGNWLEDRVSWKEELQYKEMMGYPISVQSIPEHRL